MATLFSDIQISEKLSELEQRSEADASVRLPVLYFYVSALFWLLAGTALGLLSTVQMQLPGFLADVPWLSFGRIRPASWNMLGYGWLFLTGMGTALWLLARLSRVKLWKPVVLVFAGALWNLGVLIGTLGILSAQSTSIEWLEFPAYTAPILFIAFSLIGIWALGMFCFRRPGRLYISEWYLIAAFFWFPWAYGTAHILLFGMPVQGVVQVLAASWYGSSLLWLWWTPLALAAAYYLIPQVTGRTITNYDRAFTGFWSLALLASSSGANQWIGGPIPAWILTVSILSGVLLILPVMVIGNNLLNTLSCAFKKDPDLLKQSPALRFIRFGAVCFVLAGLLSVLSSFRLLNKWTHFTYFTLGHAQLALYGFLTMTFLGAIYYILPRLVQKEWSAPRSVAAHFRLTALSVILMVVALAVGGIVQGVELSDPAVTLIQIARSLKPFLIVWSASLALLLLAQMIFAVSFARMLLCQGAKK